ncbi:hypothetical protein [Sphingomonas montanisoli]|uniref:Uncharacterized protein n=1 Tax=Sphingomonas montanisoli TaxID=2606412 RepID=A0A5D9C1K9_9SPHN|nr:hypothetical protein [Sphingomonas montanisoli]TZG25748.1 hypothetical protein FYJ91_12145 [Sphingomonas montanisoli]
MVEGRWTDPTKTPAIDWTASAALENVERGGQDVAEVTNLNGAVRAWLLLEPQHKASAVLTVEHPIQLDGIATTSFSGETIAALAEHLPNVPQDR